MIYIEEKAFKRQIELLALLAESKKYNICAWLYPESKVKDLAGFKVCTNKSQLEPITTYGDGFVPLHTEIVHAKKESIKAFSDSESELQANCDSLALYLPNSSNWEAATVGHEGICLVKPNEVLPKIVNSGFNATTEAPEWW